jgi:HEAT repeat protein/cyclophilin family peptidyl-prolyl cis-trans isomerase
MLGLGGGDDPLDEIADRETRRVTADGRLAAFAAHEDPAVRRAAVRALGRIQDRATLPAVLARFEDPDPAVRREALFAAGQLAAPGAVEPLVRAARREEGELRARAVEALGRVPGADAGFLQGALAGDPDARVRGEAALALWRAGARPAFASLRAATADTSAEVRFRAVYALVRLKAAEARPEYARALRDPDARGRMFAARGLRETPDPAAAAELAAAVDDPDWRVAVEAAWALGGCGGETRVWEALGRAARHRSFHVRGAALSALDGPLATDERARGMVEAALRDPSPTVRLHAAHRLGAVRRAAALPELAALAADPDWRVRMGAARGLSEIGAADPPEALLRLLEDPDPRVRIGALERLDRFKGSAVARERALEALGVRDLGVRGTAATLLATLGRPEDADALRAARADSGALELGEVRVNVLDALAKVLGKGALRDLEDGLADRDPQVREGAAKALGTLTGEPRVHALERERSAGEPAPGDVPRGEVRARLRTERGDLVLRLFPDEAPRHVAVLLALARRGFYRDLTFHRVELNFVVQGGDPRGDGWGGPGFFLPDEINLEPFTEGTLGMPKAGKETGGCQLFLTHHPTPHLDGRYTVFGRVVEGGEVLERLEIGDAIRGLERLE